MPLLSVQFTVESICLRANGTRIIRVTIVLGCHGNFGYPNKFEALVYDYVAQSNYISVRTISYQFCPKN